MSSGTATTALGQTISVYGGNQIQTALNFAPEFTNATNASLGFFGGGNPVAGYGGMGIHSVTQAFPAASYALSDIVQTGASLAGANIAVVFRNT